MYQYMLLCGVDLAAWRHHIQFASCCLCRLSRLSLGTLGCTSSCTSAQLDGATSAELADAIQLYRAGGDTSSQLPFTHLTLQHVHKV